MSVCVFENIYAPLRRYMVYFQATVNVFMVCVRQITWHFQCKPYVCRHASPPFLCCPCLSITLPIGHAGPVDHKMWVLLKINKTQQQIGNLGVNSNVTVTSCVALAQSINCSQPQFLQLRMRHTVSLGSFSAPVSNDFRILILLLLSTTTPRWKCGSS